MKKVFLDDLPRKGKYVDWKKSVGYKVKFVYEDIDGEIEILGRFTEGEKRKRSKLIIKYKDKTIKMQPDDFSKCKIGNLLNKFTSDYHYKIGDMIEDVNNGKLQIVECIRIETKGKPKGYRYKCLICDNEDKISECDLKRKRGCNACACQKVLRGYNDIHTTTPELGKLLANHEDGYKYLRSSHKCIDFRCSHCNTLIKNKTIDNIYRQGLSCPQCSDGMKYPEKFIFSVLEQLKIDFEFHKTFKWSKNIKFKNGKLEYKEYDFYIPLLDCIIETHGGQHYKESGRGKTLKEEKANDRLKEKLAKNNGIDKYIVIDCRYSDMEYIKENVLRSELNLLFDLSLIDWLKAHKFSCSTRTKEVCDLWEKGIKNTKEIASTLKLSRTSVIDYLKKGSNLRWCDYDPEAEQRKGGEKNSKPVVQLSLDGEYLNTFKSMTDSSKELNIKYQNISNVCRGIQKTAGGYRWVYLEDYERLSRKFHNH